MVKIHGTEGLIICDNTSDTLTLFNAKYCENRHSGDGPRSGVLVAVNNHNVAAEVDEFVKCLQSGKRPPTDEMLKRQYRGSGSRADLLRAAQCPVKVKPACGCSDQEKFTAKNTKNCKEGQLNCRGSI